jgi:hypothetical protein
VWDEPQSSNAYAPQHTLNNGKANLAAPLHPLPSLSHARISTRGSSHTNVFMRGEEGVWSKGFCTMQHWWLHQTLHKKVQTHSKKVKNPPVTVAGEQGEVLSVALIKEKSIAKTSKTSLKFTFV